MITISGWQKQYENDLYKLLEESGLTVTPAMKELVLGGEVAMWAEQTDSFSIESKVCIIIMTHMCSSLRRRPK